ncbi:hypothetical protein D3C87_1667620 [compost metagenome]
MAARAAAQFRQRQVRIVNAEGFQDAHCPPDRDHAFLGGIVLGGIVFGDACVFHDVIRRGCPLGFIHFAAFLAAAFAVFGINHGTQHVSLYEPGLY